MTGHFLIVDCSGFIYRAYFGTPPRTRSDGLETHAIIGFLSMTWQMMGRADNADPPTHIAAVFDHPGKTFRHSAFPAYKANRKHPEGLVAQFPLVREAARAMGIETIEVKGYEADDVVATLATRAKATGLRTTVVGIDKDLYQLVEDGWVEIADPVQRIRVLAADVEKKFGVPPRLMADLQAICGDPVDGIPGIPGVGVKTAAGLLRRFGSAAALVKAVAEGTHGISKPALRSNLRRHHQDILTYLKLTTLKRDIKLEIDFEALKPKEVLRSHLTEMLRLIEAEHLLDTLFRSSEGKIVFRRVPAEPNSHFHWWREELRRPGQRIPETPQCGFFRRKLVKGGEWVAARIWREPDIDIVTGERSNMEKLLCEVNGERQDSLDQWGYLSMNPITEEDYRKMMKEPPQNPKQPVDWNKCPI